jgi:hypothetical protein
VKERKPTAAETVANTLAHDRGETFDFSNITAVLNSAINVAIVGGLQMRHVDIKNKVIVFSDFSQLLLWGNRETFRIEPAPQLGFTLLEDEHSPASFNLYWLPFRPAPENPAFP